MSSEDESPIDVQQGLEPAMRHLEETDKLISVRNKIVTELELHEFDYNVLQNSEDGLGQSGLVSIEESITQMRNQLTETTDCLVKSIYNSIQSLQNAKKFVQHEHEDVKIVDSQIEKMYDVLSCIESENLSADSKSQKLEASLLRIFESPTAAHQSNFSFNPHERTNNSSISDISSFAESSQGHYQPNQSIVKRQQSARERAVEMQNEEILNRITRHALHEQSQRTVERGDGSSIKMSDSTKLQNELTAREKNVDQLNPAKMVQSFGKFTPESISSNQHFAQSTPKPVAKFSKIPKFIARLPTRKKSRLPARITSRIPRMISSISSQRSQQSNIVAERSPKKAKTSTIPISRIPTMKISKTKSIKTRPSILPIPTMHVRPVQFRTLKPLPKIKFTFAERDAEYEKIISEQILPEFGNRGRRMSPFMWEKHVTDAEIPGDIIEQDVLYVATIFADKSIEELPVRFNQVVGDILKTAKKFIKGTISQETATLVIKMLLKKFECVPFDFCQNFIFSRKNPHFTRLHVKEVEQNEYLRASQFKLNFIRCQQQFIKVYDEHDVTVGLEELIEKPKFDPIQANVFGGLDNLTQLCEKIVTGNWNKPKDSDKENWGEVVVNGLEKSNDGHTMLAFPGQIQRKMRHDIPNIETQFGSIPPANIAADIINDELSSIHQQKSNLNESKVFRQGINYLLTESALKTHTYFQARGSEMPAWFPGFYFVFPDSFGLKPTVVDPSQAMFHAWRSLAPFKSEI